MNIKTASIISIGLILAATIFGLFFLNARSNQQTVSVVGYATQDFECVLVKWELHLTQNVGKDEDKLGLERINQNLNRFKKFVKDSDIKIEELNIQPNVFLRFLFCGNIRKFNRNFHAVPYKDGAQNASCFFGFLN